MKLDGDVEIIFEGHVVTEEFLKPNREKAKGQASLALYCGRGETSSICKNSHFYGSLIELTPLTIKANSSAGPLRLQASFEVFTEFSKDDPTFYTKHYSLRLVPTQGEVAAVELDRGANFAGIAAGAQITSGDYGNGHLHFEIYNKPTEVSSKLVPPRI